MAWVVFIVVHGWGEQLNFAFGHGQDVAGAVNDDGFSGLGATATTRGPSLRCAQGMTLSLSDLRRSLYRNTSVCCDTVKSRGL